MCFSPSWYVDLNSNVCVVAFCFSYNLGQCRALMTAFFYASVAGVFLRRWGGWAHAHSLCCVLDIRRNGASVSQHLVGCLRSVVFALLFHWIRNIFLPSFLHRCEKRSLPNILWSFWHYCICSWRKVWERAARIFAFRWKELLPNLLKVLQSCSFCSMCVHGTVFTCYTYTHEDVTLYKNTHTHIDTYVYVYRMYSQTSCEMKQWFF